MDTRLPVSTSDLGSYNDLNALQKLKAPSQADDLGTIQKVAAQFESMFVNLIMKTMRQANQVLGEDNPLNSQQTRFYQGMYDQELAQKLSGQGGMGLQDVLVRQLSPKPVSDSGINNRLQVDASLRLSPGAESKGASLQSAADSPLQQQLAERRLSVAQRRVSPLNMDAPKAHSNEGAALIPGLAISDFDAQKSPMRSLVDAISSMGETASAASIAGPKSFVNELMPYAKAAAERIGVPPQYLLAQAALETGWGKHMIGGEGENTSHNLFGIKAHKSWQGDTRSVMTHEYRQGVAIRQQDRFRAYPDWSSSFQDYVDFLQENPRYEKALASTAKPEQFLNELQRAGYATDPRYAEKIAKIARSPEMQEALSRLL